MKCPERTFWHWFFACLDVKSWSRFVAMQMMVLWHKFKISQEIWPSAAWEVTKSNSWQGWGEGQALHCQEQKSHRSSYKRSTNTNTNTNVYMYIGCAKILCKVKQQDKSQVTEQICLALSSEIATYMFICMTAEQFIISYLKYKNIELLVRRM